MPYFLLVVLSFAITAEKLIACDPTGPDYDMDGISDDCDNCPEDPNSGQEDQDGDLDGDACDNCVDIFNPNQNDFDFDGIGDACSDDPLDYHIEDCDLNGVDSDQDGFSDDCDNCPNDYNPDQADANRDSYGDACPSDAPDSDNDGVIDAEDNCVNVANPGQEDDDLDQIGNACETVFQTGDIEQGMLEEELLFSDVVRSNYVSYPWGSDGNPAVQPPTFAGTKKYLCVWGDTGTASNCNNVQFPTETQCNANGYCQWSAGTCEPHTKLACQDKVNSHANDPNTFAKSIKLTTYVGRRLGNLGQEFVNYDEIYLDFLGHGPWPKTMAKFSKDVMELADKATLMYTRSHGCSTHNLFFDPVTNTHNELTNVHGAAKTRFVNEGLVLRQIANQFTNTSSPVFSEQLLNESYSTIKVWYEGQNPMTASLEVHFDSASGYYTCVEDRMDLGAIGIERACDDYDMNKSDGLCTASDGSNVKYGVECKALVDWKGNKIGLVVEGIAITHYRTLQTPAPPFPQKSLIGVKLNQNKDPYSYTYNDANNICQNQYNRRLPTKFEAKIIAERNYARWFLAKNASFAWTTENAAGGKKWTYDIMDSFNLGLFPFTAHDPAHFAHMICVE